MEKKILKENNKVLNISKPIKQFHSPVKVDNNKQIEQGFSPDTIPVIKSISVKSSEIQFEEKCPERYKIRFKKHFYVSEREVLSLRYDDKDSMIANGTSDGYIKLFNIKTKKLAYSINTASQNNQENTVLSSVSCLRWKPSADDVLLASTNGKLLQYKISNFESLTSEIKEENNDIFAIDYNFNGDLFASAGRDSKIRIYDDSTKKVLLSLEGRQWVSPGHTNRVFSVKFINDDPNVLISGGWDNAAYMWDIRLKRSIDSMFGVCLMGDSLDYKNGQILIGNKKNKEQLQLYDYKTRGLLKIIDWEVGYKLDGINVYTAQFCKKNDDLIMAGVSGGFNQMKIFSKKNNYSPVFCANYLPKGCYTSDFGNSSNNLAFGGGEGYVYICSIYNI